MTPLSEDRRERAFCGVGVRNNGTGWLFSLSPLLALSMSCARCPTPFAQQHLKLLGPPNSGRSVAEYLEHLECRDVRRYSDNALSHARHMTPTAAASVGARRRRPSPPTDGSHGRAVSKNLGRCAPAGCSATSGRSPETPGSLPSTPGPEGERQWSAASATLRSAPRPHRLRVGAHAAQEARRGHYSHRGPGAHLGVQ